MALTKSQAQIIKSTVPIIEQYGRKITECFYHDMLTEVPSLNEIFNQANQVSGHQSQALASALYAYAANLDNLDSLKFAIERINHKHASLYIRPDQYPIVGKYLIAAMQKVLGDALTPDILEAWKAAYQQLADIMIAREKQLLDQAAGWTDWRDFRIDKKIKESEEITSFYLTPVNATNNLPLPPFLPGQYISLRTSVPALHYDQARQYSLSSAPDPQYYRISVKRERGLDMQHPDAPAHLGYISNILHDHKSEGDIVKVSHPFGEFYLDLGEATTSPIVLLSAGVGLTPLLAILETLVAQQLQHHTKLKRRISWIHATRSSSVQAFASYINHLAATHVNINKKVFLRNVLAGKDVQGDTYDFEGRMDLGKLDPEQDLYLGDAETEYYVCGPEGFMLDMERWLRSKGVDEGRVHVELFGTGGLPKI